MKYKVTHITHYQYDSSVSLCHNVVYQSPLNNELQKVIKHEYKISPLPDFSISRTDFFNNKFLYFAVEKTHIELDVRSIFTVEIIPSHWNNINPAETPSWEKVRDLLKSHQTSNDIRQFCLESPFVVFLEELRQYALESFTPNRPIMEAMLELNSRINNDFKYTPGFTEISTPLHVVFNHKKGVCQDFAHLALSCIRSIGLSGKYVSGYIETIPPKGKPKLIGSDASHAWMSIYIPSLGWIEMDATNNLLVQNQHIRAAQGRDFSDVVPLKGIAYTGGGHQMNVSVEVTKQS